ncbi:hypothetical protein [Bremerella alba]|uniref:Uncharacterized protein n=1 Tax=Bremerella alba TaxID=980252 RepID=A0A7V8V6E3_9BACT|nr:hypothetical protein [Bremerella alba]MBA2115814.1 hypothetical protein [Bremerella alba]
MSTDAPSSITTAQAVPTQSVGTDSIRRKINRTRRSVKLAELVAGLLMFVAGSLLFLLTLAVVDHWIVGLNFAARLLAFLVYVVAAVGFLWVYVAPLLFQSINPLYAAKMIEQGQPTLKNSLLNFLFLNQNNQGTHKAILDAVETQAASDISSLSLEHLVDYSKAIRIGYILAALAVLFGLYTVLSPKNPLQTAARIAMPWNDIARPSRVKIVDVQPGDTSIYQGQEIDVVVKLHDVADGDRLEVIYSTKDGQLVDQAIPLQASDDGFDYQAKLSTSESGIQQDLIYRIEAGDAATRDFEITTIEAPSIDVESLRYDPPAYTKESPWEQQGDGHIRALEGTMVTIRTISNRPIKKAYIEFDPVADSPIVSLNTTPLQVSSEEPTKASVRFPLEMNDAGTAGKFRSYQIRFRTEDGVLNPHPVLYHIDVVRDLPPEIEYLEPTASEVELPANRSLDVRLRAIDPDFGIRQLRVTGTISQAGGPRLEKTIDASILDQPKSGQVIESWKLVPKEHKLEVGDIVKLIGVAEDTRTDFTGKLKPNIARTNPRTIRIVEPVAGEQQGDKSQDEGSTSDQGEQSDEQSESNDSGEQGEQEGDGSESGESGDMSEGEKGNQESQSEGNSGEDSNQEGMKGQSDKPQEGENDGESEDQQSGQGSGSSSKKEPGDENQDPQQGKGSEPQEGEQQSGEPQEGDPQSGEGGMGQSQEEGGDQESQSKSNGGQGGEASQSSDDQQREQNQSEQTGQPNGSGTGKAGDPNKGGELQQGDASTQPNENSTVEKRQDPVAPDGSQDGDAFERIQDYLKEKQEQQGQQPSPENSDQPNPQQQGQGEGSGTGQKPEEGMQDGASGNSQQDPSDSQGQNSEGQNNQGQKNQGQGSKQGSNEQSTGELERSQPNENGVDNGMKPENSAGGENASGEQEKEGEPGTTDNNQGQSSERDTQNDEQGAGENKGGAVQEEQEANPSDDSERSGDTGKGDNTDSGAGSKSNEGDKGSPESSEKANKQSENNMKPDDRSSDEQGDQPKSPSNSDKQSDSKGETRGDQSGGGGSGGGQSAKQAGNDSAGSTSAADQGAGAANQQGEGETGQEGGDGPQADEQTGSSGDEKGDGSSKTNSPAGQEAGMEGADSERGPNDSQQSNDPQQSGRGPGNSTVPQGGGLEGNNTPQDNDGPRVEPGEDAANLDYAKQATDMVLDQLQHQESPDQEMLDELGWSKDDFARFVQRWKQMKQAAGSEDAQAKQDLNDALRSLGLSRGEDTTRRVESRDAAASGGSSDTQRSSPPPSFMEQYRAYLKGASQ